MASGSTEESFERRRRRRRRSVALVFSGDPKDSALIVTIERIFGLVRRWLMIQCRFYLGELESDVLSFAFI